MQELLKATRALSDETRLRILNVLLERECCVCEVMQALEISQSRASRNLGILFNAGFLRTRRDGPWVLYSLDTESDNHVAVTLVNSLEGLLAGNEIAVLDRKRLAGAERVGPGCVNRDTE